MKKFMPKLSRGEKGLKMKSKSQGCYHNAKTKKPNNDSSDKPWHAMKIKCCSKNKGCCTKPHFYPQGMKKGNINHAPKKPRLN
jgi:hypothetical protein